MLMGSSSWALAGDPGTPPQGRQSAVQFAASYAINAVSNISATTQKVSCYSPEVTYFDTLAPA